MNDSTQVQAQLNSNLAYDDAAHEYTLSNVRVPSVTAIISDVMNGGKKPFFPPGSGERGRMVHLACELDDLNDLDDATLDPALAGYVAAWRAFKATARPRWLGIEARVFSAAHGYAGTLDRLAEVETGETTVIDIKSGKPYQSHALQTAAYAIAYEEETGIAVPRRLCVYVEGDGAFYMQEHTEHNDRAAFLAARTFFRWRNRW
jgi:hypothetical protein